MSPLATYTLDDPLTVRLSQKLDAIEGEMRNQLVQHLDKTPEDKDSSSQERGGA